MSDLQKQIKKTLGEVNQVEKIKKHLASLEERLAAAYQAQDKLVKVLETEYEDLDQLDSFSRFMDVFFDNLISDWVIQQKIQNALSNVNAVRDRLLRLLQGLKTEEMNSQKAIKKLRRQRKKMLST